MAFTLDSFVVHTLVPAFGRSCGNCQRHRRPEISDILPTLDPASLGHLQTNRGVRTLDMTDVMRGHCWIVLSCWQNRLYVSLRTVYIYFCYM